MYAAVFAGGAAGSLLRELIVSQNLLWWPMSTSLVVNLIACFAIGWLYAIRRKIHTQVLHLGAVGFCGGLSTFSSFAADIVAYVTAGEMATAVASVVLEICLGLVAVVLGERLGNQRQSTPA